VWAFLGVAIAAVSLGDALAMHNEVRSTNVTHVRESRIRFSTSPLKQAICNAHGIRG
jgi:hypothetical protein